MNRYGQSITWGTLSAPQLFTGHCTHYSYRDAVQQQMHDDMVGDHTAFTLHSRKADLDFTANITSGSTDFLDLSGSNGAKITVSGVSGGVVLVSRAVESWRLGQRKSASITAVHYPDFAVTTGTAAGAGLDAFTPDQSALGINYPGGTVIWGTYGMTHASGVIHGLTVEQSLTITEDDISPDGKILGCAAHGYMRTIQLELLATGTALVPRGDMTLTGAPSHTANYKITSAEKAFEDLRGMMYRVSAVWIPALG